MRLLDLFCGAGGAAMGYHLALEDADIPHEIVGIDNVPQPRYPFRFVLGDALEPPVRLEDFDFIHASPPCQAYSLLTRNLRRDPRQYPDLLAPTRELLDEVGIPYVIENVPGAPMKEYVQICGSGLGVPLRRHRWFESTLPLFGVPCAHGQFPYRPEFGASTNRKQRRVVVLGEWRVPFPLQKEASGIDWMTLEELSEAIPPAYTRYIMEQFISQMAVTPLRS